MSTYELVASMPVGDGEVEITIAFDYTPSRPAIYSGPMMSPSEDARLEFLTCYIKGDNPMPLPMQIVADEWAEDYLDNDGRDRALDVVGR